MCVYIHMYIYKHICFSCVLPLFSRRVNLISDGSRPQPRGPPLV